MNDPKLSIRPIIKTIKEEHLSSDDERFQNETLRPIIKLQHELIMSCFKHHLIHHKIIFSELEHQKKEGKLSQLFSKDKTLVTDLRCLIIGHFTMQEFLYYLDQKTIINKRISSIIKQRIWSQQ